MRVAAVASVLLHSLLFTLSHQQDVSEDRPIVSTSQGFVRGFRAADGAYSVFAGIPYATVPTNRFGEPEPAPIWDTIFEANQLDVRCPQSSNRMTRDESMTMDCLVLHVFTANLGNNDISLPVMVYIHGGGLETGSGNIRVLGPEYLLKKGVVVVSINYRLGVYGFMCLKTELVKGNTGYKDQVAALKWVQNNIAAFGGDPNQVTIFGGSAGGYSVDSLILSPMSRGLFHGAIAQSAPHLAMLGLKDDSVDLAKATAYVLGKEIDDLDELAIFFNSVDPAILADSAKTAGVKFQPCVEETIGNSETFFNVAPLKILESGDFPGVPYIIGFNQDEGLFLAREANLTEGFMNNFPPDLSYSSQTEKEELTRRMIQFYIGDDTNESNVSKAFYGLGHFISDEEFVVGIYRTMLYHLKHEKGPIYFYEFAYDGGLTSDIIYNNITYPGVTHGFEIPYIFNRIENISTVAADDLLMLERTTTMWTNFAKTKNPTPEATDEVPLTWTAAQPASLHSLRIDRELSLRRRPQHARIAFWDQVYARQIKQFFDN